MLTNSLVKVLKFFEVKDGMDLVFLGLFVSAVAAAAITVAFK